MDEREAVARLKQGDLAGLDGLVDLHYVAAVRAAYLVTRDRPLAEDVAQTAFLRLVDRIGLFDAGTGAATLRVATRRVIEGATVVGLGEGTILLAVPPQDATTLTWAVEASLPITLIPLAGD